MKKFLRPLIIAGSIAVSGCSDLEQSEQGNYMEEQKVVENTKSSVDNILKDNKCTPVYLSDREKKEFEEARVSKDNALEKLRLEFESKLEQLKQKKDITKEQLRISILQVPIKTSDLLNKYFHDIQELENNYSVQKVKLEQDYLIEKKKIKSAFINNPNTKKNIEYSEYVILMKKCEIQAKLNKDGIKEYNRLDQEQINLRLKLIDRKNVKLSRLETEKNLLLNEIDQHAKQTGQYSEFNERKSRLLKELDEKKTQIINESMEKQKDLFFTYNQRKEALLNISQYIKK